MPNILYVHASPRAERSHSQVLADHVLSKLPGKVTSRDVSKSVPFVTDNQISHMYGFAPYGTLKGADKDAVDYQDAVVAEILAADTVVLSAPMWNLGMPASVKAWFDQVIRVGQTWKMSDEGKYVGLASQITRVVIVGTSGGIPAGAGHPWDFYTGHLTALFQFIGAKEVKIFWATGNNAEVIAPHIEVAKKQIDEYLK
jgi:FMN-dependent NADH-azoreductase